MKEMKANRSPAPEDSSLSSTRKTKSEFPIKLYAILELADYNFEFSQAVTWLPHGRAFRILNKDKFMNEVVPVFFNQTKIRSFNRQLHLWGFRRTCKSSDQVWYHENFLRGVPESMKHMVRTKIKGDAVGSSDEGRVPNFDNLPPLPRCYKQPSAVLDVIENSMLKLQSSLGAVTHPGSTMPILPPPKPANIDCATNYQMSLPRTEPCDFDADLNPDESFLLPVVSPLTSRPVLSCESQLMWNICGPCMHQLPFQTNRAESFTYMNQTSVQETHHPIIRSNMRDDNLDNLMPNEDFEPLPFWDDDFLCDDFANFINGAIQQVEG